MTRLPRGIRNRNPGNIRKSRDRWKGLAPAQTDPAFFVFDAPVWGIRAMAVILRNYRKRHGLKTLAQIIGRWAPAQENDTAGYVRMVAKAMRLHPRTVIDPQDPATLRDLIAAIIRHENGVQPYDPDTIETAIDLA
ncbi:MAG: structural protein [Dongiaceae bacterium]